MYYHWDHIKSLIRNTIFLQCTLKEPIVKFSKSKGIMPLKVISQLKMLFSERLDQDLVGGI